MKRVVVPRIPDNYDVEGASDESGLDCSVEPSLAKQSFAEEVDINTIVRRFGLTGVMPEGLRAPQYGDFSEVRDFHSAMNAVAQANETFDQLPADVRYRFRNDPGEFVDFCMKAENRPEMEKMGLLLPKAEALVAQDAPAAPGKGVATPEVPVAPEAVLAPGKGVKR